MTGPRIGVAAHGVSRLQGGMFFSVRELWKAVHRLGPAVEVLAIDDPHAAEDSRTYAPLDVRLFPRVGPHRVGYSPALNRALLQSASSWSMMSLHGAWIPIAAGVLSASRRRRVPYIVHPQGMLDPWALANARAKKAVARILWQDRAFARAACMRALCASERDSFRAYGLRNPIAVIPNGVALSEVQNLPPSDAFAARFPALRGRPFVLFLGRVHPKKGLVHLLEAWADVAPRGWALVVAGFDEIGHQAALESLARERGIANDVLFVGPLTGVAKREALAGARWFVLPSFSEGFPMALLEAAGAGLPVLQTPPCNFPELTRAGGAIEMQVDRKDTARALREALALSDGDRLAMGARGRELVRDRYTWDAIGAEMMSVVNWIVGGGDAPACVEAAR